MRSDVQYSLATAVAAEHQLHRAVPDKKHDRGSALVTFTGSVTRCRVSRTQTRGQRSLNVAPNATSALPSRKRKRFGQALACRKTEGTPLASVEISTRVRPSFQYPSCIGSYRAVGYRLGSPCGPLSRVCPPFLEHGFHETETGKRPEDERGEWLWYTSAWPLNSAGDRFPNQTYYVHEGQGRNLEEHSRQYLVLGHYNRKPHGAMRTHLGTAAAQPTHTWVKQRPISTAGAHCHKQRLLLQVGRFAAHSDMFHLANISRRVCASYMCRRDIMMLPSTDSQLGI